MIGFLLFLVSIIIQVKLLSLIYYYYRCYFCSFIIRPEILFYRRSRL